MTYLDQESTEGYASVEFVYEEPISWTWPKEYRMHRYTFFSSGYCAMTEDGNYEKSALVPALEFSDELIERIEKKDP